MNELQKSTGTEIGKAQDLGAGDELSIRDCPLGRLTILQSQSKLVKSEQGKQGTIINTADPMVVLGDKQNCVEFIVIGTTKYWVTTDPVTLEFLGKEPGVHKTDKKFEDTLNGRKIKNIYTMGFFVVLPKEIKDGFALPMELPTRSSSLKQGEQLALQLWKLSKKQVPSWAKVFSYGIDPELGVKGQNSWYKPVIKYVRDANPEEIQVASEYRKQYSTLVEKSMAAHEEGDEVGTVEDANAPQQF
jgi:hypothetical protein